MTRHGVSRAIADVEDVTPPRIVVTVAVSERQSRPDLSARWNASYAAAVARHGAVPLVIDADASAHDRDAAFQAMDGLLLSGGADLDPARYGQQIEGARDIEPDRDELEASAWLVATDRRLPVLGVCRGLEAINVFSGGSLVQHVDGHQGPSWGDGPAATHPIRLEPETRLAHIVGPSLTLEVNSYHHQGVRLSDLAPGLRPSAWADSASGPLVEGFESRDGRFIIGVQCHPERTESTPASFDRLFAAFVDAARAVRRVTPLG